MSAIEYRSVEERMCEKSGNDRSRWSRLYCEINCFSEPRPAGAVSCSCWTVKK